MICSSCLFLAEQSYFKIQFLKAMGPQQRGQLLKCETSGTLIYRQLSIYRNKALSREWKQTSTHTRDINANKRRGCLFTAKKKRLITSKTNH